MPRVIVRPTADRAPVRQLQITLGAFQRLDVRLLVDLDDQRALRRIEIQSDNLGCLGGKFRIVTDTPRFPPG